jgi:hypothetical protein
MVHGHQTLSVGKPWASCQFPVDSFLPLSCQMCQSVAPFVESGGGMGFAPQPDIVVLVTRWQAK